MALSFVFLNTYRLRSFTLFVFYNINYYFSFDLVVIYRAFYIPKFKHANKDISPQKLRSEPDKTLYSRLIEYIRDEGWTRFNDSIKLHPRHVIICIRNNMFYIALQEIYCSEVNIGPYPTWYLPVKYNMYAIPTY